MMDDNDKICLILSETNPRLLIGILNDFITERKYQLNFELNLSRKKRLDVDTNIIDYDVSEDCHVDFIYVKNYEHEHRIWLNEILDISQVVHYLTPPFRYLFKSWQEQNENFKKIMDEYRHLLTIRDLNLI